MISTVKDFVLCVASLDDVNNAYDVFEFDCTDDVRDAIYSLSTEDSPEPFRAAMHFLGFTDF